MTTLSQNNKEKCLGGQLITLKQVAERAGVSIKTVSRIVNGDAAVNPKTRAAVQKHLRLLNYVPNQAARQMRSGESSVYGLMTDVVATTPYSVDIVRGAQSALKDMHQTLLIASSDSDPLREEELWRMFRAHRVAGVIYAAMFHRAHDLGSPAFDNSIVLANCYHRNAEFSGIVPDDEQGGYEQARYLLQRGHRRIAVITLIREIEATQLRGIGIRRAFAEAGVKYDESLDVCGYDGTVTREISHVIATATDILTRKDRPTAIICGNDQTAMQVYAVSAQLGLSIPQDVSVIGFDDLRLISETLFPQLTTVALPYFEIGKRAAEMMTQSTSGGRAILEKIKVPCPLVERHSCRTLA
jgi:LacI family transcriptional regulator